MIFKSSKNDLSKILKKQLKDEKRAYKFSEELRLGPKQSFVKKALSYFLIKFLVGTIWVTNLGFKAFLRLKFSRPKLLQLQLEAELSSSNKYDDDGSVEGSLNEVLKNPQDINNKYYLNALTRSVPAEKKAISKDSYLGLEKAFKDVIPGTKSYEIYESLKKERIAIYGDDEEK